MEVEGDKDKDKKQRESEKKAEKRRIEKERGIEKGRDDKVLVRTNPWIRNSPIFLDAKFSDEDLTLRQNNAQNKRERKKSAGKQGRSVYRRKIIQRKDTKSFFL